MNIPFISVVLASQELKDAVSGRQRSPNNRDYRNIVYVGISADTVAAPKK